MGAASKAMAASILTRHLYASKALIPFPSLSWLISIARSSILSLLEKAIKVGYLEIQDAGRLFRYGTYIEGCNAVRVTIFNEVFWLRVFTSADLGVSESYIMGEFHVDNLKGMMDLWLDNVSDLSGLSSLFGRLYSCVSGLRNSLFGQSLHRAKLNAIASYDQSNDLFQAFLSKEMMYSCALWSEAEGGLRGDLLPHANPIHLEVAQLRKIHYVLGKARVKPGDRILEVGSGWGGLSIVAARTYGCEVDTLTLSIEQKILAEERIKLNGLEGRVRVHLLDYRQLLPEWESSFDAFISIEMLEHVGSQYYQTYFQLVDWALKPGNTTAVVTSTTFPEGRYSNYQAEDFMRRYMWPNSSLPSATALITAANQASQGRFTLQSVENHGPHYPRTLREWSRRLESNLTADMLVGRYPDLRDPACFETFKRKWQYLFAYAGAGFAKGYITCHMLTFTKNDVPVACD